MFQHLARFGCKLYYLEASRDYGCGTLKSTVRTKQIFVKTHYLYVFIRIQPNQNHIILHLYLIYYHML